MIVRVSKPCAESGCLVWHCGQWSGRQQSGSDSCSGYCCTEPANGCRICIGSASGRCELPRFVLRAGELFWMGVRGVLPLTSISYTSENVTKREGIAHQRHDPDGVLHARSQHRFSIRSGVEGTNLRKTAHYEGKNCDPLHSSKPMPVFDGAPPRTTTTPAAGRQCRSTGQLSSK